MPRVTSAALSCLILVCSACINEINGPVESDHVQAATDQELYAPAAWIEVAIQNESNQTLYYSSGICGILEQHVGARWSPVTAGPPLACPSDLQALGPGESVEVAGMGPTEPGVYRYVLGAIWRSSDPDVITSEPARVPTNAFEVKDR